MSTSATPLDRDPLDQGEVRVHLRPTVDRETIEDLVHVQELLLELTSDDGRTRIVEIGRKRLPDPSSDSPNWGYVRAVGDDDGAALLDDDTYETPTQGQRHQSSTHVVATGTWQLEREASSTVLALELDVEDRDDDLVDQLRLLGRGRYGVSAKNPRAAGDAGLDAEERPDLPDELQSAFDGNRWAPVDPVTFLDHVGVEFVLVAPDADTAVAA